MSLARKDLTPALEVAFGLKPSIHKIQDAVAEFYGIKPDYMRVPDRIGAREPRVCHPRQIAMFLTRRLTRHRLTDIGRRFGGRDHSTVIHAVRAVECRAAADPYLEMELEVLRERLSA